ncbi:MAG: hypothetical protein ABII00_13150 [Elusimicrobiota bacterium]
MRLKRLKKLLAGALVLSLAAYDLAAFHAAPLMSPSAAGRMLPPFMGAPLPLSRLPGRVPARKDAREQPSPSGPSLTSRLLGPLRRGFGAVLGAGKAVFARLNGGSANAAADGLFPPRPSGDTAGRVAGLGIPWDDPSRGDRIRIQPYFGWPGGRRGTAQSAGTARSSLGAGPGRGLDASLRMSGLDRRDLRDVRRIGDLSPEASMRVSAWSSGSREERRAFGLLTAYGKFPEQRARTADPLVFDLDGDGVRTLRRRVWFDIDGDGWRESVTDVSARDAILVFDADADGVPGEDGMEIFGEVTDIDGDGERDGHRDGFAALRALAERAAEDGLIAREELVHGVLSPLALYDLERHYGLMVRLGGLNGELVTLEDAGIREIALSRGDVYLVENFDGRGNDVVHRDGAAFTRFDGSSGLYGDIWLRKLPRGGFRDLTVAQRVQLRRPAEHPGKGHPGAEPRRSSRL